MKLDQVDTESRVLHVARLKGGLSTTQPLRGDELRAISAWLKERARMKPTGKAFFVSEQRKPLHRSTVNLLLRKYSAAASLPLLVHPHMLRHACGFALADQGRGYSAHSGLPRTPEHSAHRQVHGHQPSTVRKAVAMNQTMIRGRKPQWL
jgi:type 1 fimbriae regulatory protein FimB